MAAKEDYFINSSNKTFLNETWLKFHPGGNVVNLCYKDNKDGERRLSSSDDFSNVTVDV